MRKVILSFVADSGRNGAASLFQTEAGLKGNMNSMEEPASMGVSMAFTVP